MLLSGWTDDIFHVIHESFYEVSLGRPGIISYRISIYLTIEVMWNSNVLCAVLFWHVSCMYSNRLDVWLTVCLWIYSHGNWVVIRSTFTMSPPHTLINSHNSRAALPEAELEFKSASSAGVNVILYYGIAFLWSIGDASPGLLAHCSVSWKDGWNTATGPSY